MNTSVDRLFENEGDVFLSSSYADFQQLPSIQETTGNSQPKAPPRTRGQSKSPDGEFHQGTPVLPGRQLRKNLFDSSTVYLFVAGIKADPSATSTPERRVAGRESPAPSTARSSRRDSLAEKPTGIAAKIQEPTAIPVRPSLGGDQLEQSYNGDLFKAYQKQKQKLQEKFQQREREWDDLVRQLSAPLPAQMIDNRLQGDG